MRSLKMTNGFQDIKDDGAVYVGQPKIHWLLGVYSDNGNLVDVTYDGRIDKLQPVQLRDLLCRLDYLTEYVNGVIADKQGI